MKLLCKFGLHDWSDVQHRPCERYQTCARCSKEKVFKGWHCFEKWSDTFYVDVTFTYGGDPIQTIRESKQKRYCTNCKLYDERILE